MQKTKSTKKRTRKKSSVPFSLPKPLFILLAAIVGLATIFIILIVTLLGKNAVELNTQKQRLDLVSEDLRKVYDKLAIDLPNIREKSFEKSCGQASSKGTGVITCGTYINIVRDNVSQDKLVASQQMYKDDINNFKSFTYTSISKLNDDTNATGSYIGGSGFIHNKLSLECSIDDRYYKTFREYDRNRMGNHETYYDGIHSTNIVCSDVASSFFIDYKAR